LRALNLLQSYVKVGNVNILSWGIFTYSCVYAYQAYEPRRSWKRPRVRGLILINTLGGALIGSGNRGIILI